MSKLLTVTMEDVKAVYLEKKSMISLYPTNTLAHDAFRDFNREFASYGEFYFQSLTSILKSGSIIRFSNFYETKLRGNRFDLILFNYYPSDTENALAQTRLRKNGIVRVTPGAL